MAATAEGKSNDVARAYDAIADHYDLEVAGDAWMREMLWSRYDAAFSAGDHVLDLGSGTGLDAIHLARRGIRVTAIDASPEMVALTKNLAIASGVAHQLEARRLEFGALPLLGPQSFDGAISAFGALNTVQNVRHVAWDLSRLLRPHARLIVHALNRTSLWECLDLLRRGQWSRVIELRRRAARNFQIGGLPVLHYMWRAGDAYEDWSPYFSLRELHGMGIIRPPHTIHRLPVGMVQTLARLDAVVAPHRPFAHWGRFIVMEMEVTD